MPYIPFDASFENLNLNQQQGIVNNLFLKAPVILLITLSASMVFTLKFSKCQVLNHTFGESVVVRPKIDGNLSSDLLSTRVLGFSEILSNISDMGFLVEKYPPTWRHKFHQFLDINRKPMINTSAK